MLVAGVLAVGAGVFAGAFGASGAVTDVAGTYLRISAIGVPAMFLVLAATGVLSTDPGRRAHLRAPSVSAPHEPRPKRSKTLAEQGDAAILGHYGGD